LDHAADLVGAGLHALLGHHLAHRVGAGLGALLRHHLADGVGAGLGLLLGHVAAAGVGHHLLADLLFIADAVDGLFTHFRHPDLLADLAGRALHAHDLALAGAVDALAAARIPHPATRLTHDLLDDRAGALGHLGFPATAADLDRLGVV